MTELIFLGFLIGVFYAFWKYIIKLLQSFSADMKYYVREALMIQYDSLYNTQLEILNDSFNHKIECLQQNHIHLNQKLKKLEEKYKYLHSIIEQAEE